MNDEKKNIHENEVNLEASNLSNDTEEKRTPKLQQALEELECMEKHPEEYKSFNSVSELIDDIMSEDN